MVWETCISSQNSQGQTLYIILKSKVRLRNCHHCDGPVECYFRKRTENERELRCLRGPTWGGGLSRPEADLGEDI